MNDAAPTTTVGNDGTVTTEITVAETRVLDAQALHKFPDATGLDVRGGAVVVVQGEKVMATFAPQAWVSAHAAGTRMRIVVPPKDRDMPDAKGQPTSNAASPVAVASQDPRNIFTERF